VADLHNPGKDLAMTAAKVWRTQGTELRGNRTGFRPEQNNFGSSFGREIPQGNAYWLAGSLQAPWLKERRLVALQKKICDDPRNLSLVHSAPGHRGRVLPANHQNRYDRARLPPHRHQLTSHPN
jgi:hypothetical protein